MDSIERARRFYARYLTKLEEKKKSYEWYKAHHVCVQCHGADAKPGHVLCTDCAEKVNRKRRETHDKRKAAGCCPRCGAKLPESEVKHGYVYCRACRRYNAKYDGMKRKKK